ncbi:MAG TPA: DUF1552 domain-containing protein [Polyangiales bacterium]|nr:DUF1552 domain-containing protein [Polyangiales bacterium]
MTSIDPRTRLSRRKLLQGVSALGVLLASPVWRPATVFGQDLKTKAARRFIGVFTANGTIASEFFPAGNGSEAALSAGSLPQILKPFQAHVAQLSVLKGLHMSSTVEDELGKPSMNKPGGPHMKGPGAMLTGGSLMAGSFGGAGGPAGYADRISVDQLIANRIAASSGKTKFASLEFGVRIEGQEPLRVISYRGANQPNTALDDPWQMYNRLFADSQRSEAELARNLAEQRSVLDFLKDDISKLETRFAGADRARLDAHLTGLRSLEERLNGAATSCTPLALPTKLNPRDMANFPTIGKLQMDLLLLAHACNLTRVSTFMWANADSWQYYPWIGVNEEHHELSHAGDGDMVSREKLVKINRWHAEQVAYLIDGLAQREESDGSRMLDNTVLLWGNEIGVGNTHTHKNIPWLLAGGAGGYLKTGRHLQFDRPHNDLLVSVCNAMGYDDVESFGIPGVCTGALTNLVA